MGDVLGWHGIPPHHDGDALDAAEIQLGGAVAVVDGPAAVGGREAGPGQPDGDDAGRRGRGRGGDVELGLEGDDAAAAAVWSFTCDFVLEGYDVFFGLGAGTRSGSDADEQAVLGGQIDAVGAVLGQRDGRGVRVVCDEGGEVVGLLGGEAGPSEGRGVEVAVEVGAMAVADGGEVGDAGAAADRVVDAGPVGGGPGAGRPGLVMGSQGLVGEGLGGLPVSPKEVHFEGCCW